MLPCAERVQVLTTPPSWLTLSVSLPRRREEEENGEGDSVEYVLKQPNSAKRQRPMMSPHQHTASHHGSPLSNFHIGGPPSWNDFVPANGHPNGYTFHAKQRLNDSPASNSSNLSPMSINSLLCETRDPIYTPPKTDYISHGTENSFVFDPVPATIEPLVLHTRTPPPLSGIAPLWQEIEYHPSDESADEDDDPEIEEIPHRPSEDVDALIPSPKRRRLSSFVSSDAYNLHMLPHDELNMWNFYDNVTCKILSCKNAVGENPWRDELIGRAQQSDPLKHALFAMTRFHMKRYQTDDFWAMATLGLNHTNLSFRALREAMNDGKAFADENNIAAMLVLSFSQVYRSVI